MKKTCRSAIAFAVGPAAILTMTGLTPLPAKADTTFTSEWFSEGSGDCLGVQGANMTNGTAIVQWPCNGHPDQIWEIQTVDGPPSNDGYTIIWTQIVDSQDTSKCLGVGGGSIANGANLVIWDCNGHPDQRWLFATDVPPSRGIPDGCYIINSYNSITQVIGVQGDSTAPGAPAVLSWGEASPATVWCSTIGDGGGSL